MIIMEIVRKDLKRLLSDRKALLVNVALPLILTAIMGFSFGGGSAGSSGLSTIAVAMVGDDLPSELKSRLADAVQESDFLSITWTDSLTADQWVRSGEYVAAIVLPSKMLTRLLSEEFVTVQVWQDPGSPLKAGIVAEILNRMVVRYQAGDAAYLALWPEDRSDENSDLLSGDDFEEFFSGNFNAIWQRLRNIGADSERRSKTENFLTIVDHQVALSQAIGSEVVSLKIHNKGPVGGDNTGDPINLFDYFLPTFSVFFLMFAVSAATRDIHRERQRLTLQRQLLSPLRSWQFIVGKWLVATVQGVMQLSVLFIAGAVFFQVNLGPDFYSLVFVIILTSTSAAGVFILLAVVTSTEKIMDNLSTMFVLISAMIGGNFVPIDNMPAWAQSAGQFVFNYWANQSFRGVVVHNQSFFEAPAPALILASLSLTLFVVNVMLFSWRARRGGMS